MRRMGFIPILQGQDLSASPRGELRYILTLRPCATIETICVDRETQLFALIDKSSILFRSYSTKLPHF